MSNDINHRSWKIIVSSIALLFAGVWLFCCLHHAHGGGHAGCGCCGSGGWGNGAPGNGSPIKSGTTPTTVVQAPVSGNPTGNTNNDWITITITSDGTVSSNEIEIFVNTTITDQSRLVIKPQDGTIISTHGTNWPQTFTAQNNMISGILPQGLVQPGDASLQLVLLAKIQTSNGATTWSGNNYPVPNSSGKNYYNGTFTAATGSVGNLSMFIGDQGIFFH